MIYSTYWYINTTISIIIMITITTVITIFSFYVPGPLVLQFFKRTMHLPKSELYADHSAWNTILHAFA